MTTSTTALDPSEEEREEVLQAALTFARRYFTDFDVAPVHPRVSAERLREVVNEPLPLEPTTGRALVEQFEEVVAPYCRNNGHPRMFGYITSAGTFTGAVAGFLTTVLNQNVTSWRSAPGPTTVELLVVDWIREFIGFAEGGGGLLLSGGSMANFAGLLTAVRAKTGVDLDRNGIRELEQDPVIYASERVHVSVPKAAALMGLGRKAVRMLPPTSEGTLDPDRLDEAVRRDRAEGRWPLAVVANAGDVNAGVVDPIDPIVSFCAEEDLWCHVDAAYGGFAAAVPSLRPLFQGMDRADSVALDPHKWLYIPLDAGCLLVRDLDRLHDAFGGGADYMDVLDAPSDFAFWNLGPELSRRFRALHIWMILKRHGARAIAAAIERNVELAATLRERVVQAEDFELLGSGPLSIVCFRYVPAALRERIEREGAAARPSVERSLDAINRAITVELQRGGHDCYLSNATSEGRFCLRACFVNHRTGEEDLDVLLTTLRRVGRGMEHGAEAS